MLCQRRESNRLLEIVELFRAIKAIAVLKEIALVPNPEIVDIVGILHKVDGRAFTASWHVAVVKDPGRL